MSNHVHLLLMSSTYGLLGFTQRLLIGYAITYNLRHRRHGHWMSVQTDLSVRRTQY